MITLTYEVWHQGKNIDCQTMQFPNLKVAMDAICRWNAETLFERFVPVKCERELIETETDTF